MPISKEKTLIGRAEKIEFPLLGGSILHARVDTGAKTSSIWAATIREEGGVLVVRFADPTYEIYKHEHTFTEYERVIVASSMGATQERYKVKMPIIVKGRRIMATFTLSDRSTQVYPVLLGRSTLYRKFIVDVSQGEPLRELEEERSNKLQTSIKKRSL